MEEKKENGNGIEKFIKEDFIEFVKETTKTNTTQMEVQKLMSDNIAIQNEHLNNVIARQSKVEELLIQTNKILQPTLNLHNWIVKILIAILIAIVAKFLMIDIHTLLKLLGGS